MNESQKKTSLHSFPLMGIERFKDRLVVAMRDEKPRAIAQRTDFSEGALRSYMSGDTYPALDRLQRLAFDLGVDPNWLATGQGEEEVADDFIFVEQMSISGQALVQRRHAVRRGWVQEQGLDPARLTALEARDSMEPTMQPGDVLICESYMHTSDTRIEAGLAPGELPPVDGIYLVRFLHNGSQPTAFRRIRLDMAGGFFLSADADTSVHLHMKGDALAKLRILARVVMLQRRV